VITAEPGCRLPTSLATLNVKDYRDFAEHEGLTIITQ
jgi:hypothetical protein